MSKVSIILAVHNGEKFLAKAIESVLVQTFPNFEFLIIDDASEDKTTRIIKKFAIEDKRIKVLTNKKRLGLTKSLNKAIKQAKGDYIARMDGDDICLPDRLAKQVTFIEKNQDIAFCGTAAILIDEYGKKIGKKIHPLNNRDIRRAALRYCPFIHPTLIFRRLVLQNEEGYNEEFPFAQDYELVLRLLGKYKAANLSQPLIFYRVGVGESISYQHLKKQEWLALKARWLALTKYGFPKSDFWKIIKPAISFLVPVPIKLFIYQKFFYTSS